ncbi:MAG: hypothetical protein UX94_C0002G0027 [Parcubacteria group bacterium GW2011_GWA2_47_21]|nr:MAG: hypothetical protein UX94_C0002G0027 [Parcubacteria group bacterium GW2011_GWA2_47_21]
MVLRFSFYTLNFQSINLKSGIGVLNFYLVASHDPAHKRGVSLYSREFVFVCLSRKVCVINGLLSNSIIVPSGLE